MELRSRPGQPFGELRSDLGGKLRTAAVTVSLVAATTMWSGAAAQIMMLPGQFDVSPAGAALYSVPIEVPPGTAGMSPALTLEYDSDGGNGLLGVGWNLGGLPSIGRCPKTVATDGVKGRVSFALTDRFCMDGQRLILKTGTYGAAGSEYRTEIEGFTKIVASGTAGNGPASFTAWTKSGQIIEFGGLTHPDGTTPTYARILASGTSTVRSWATNKITDTKGNYLTVTYNNDPTYQQTYPTRIDYTGNVAANLATYNSVQFEYDSISTPRPDVVPLYISGSIVKNTVRLKKIKTYAGATPVRVYELTYGVGSSTDRSRITSIKLCDGTGTNCLPATSFALSDTTSLTFPQTSTNPIATSEMGGSVALYVGDWNGDGFTDAMTWNPSNGTNKWFVNNGALAFTTTTNPISTAQITGQNSLLNLGDWDGDAITDVVWLDPSTGNNRWFINSSTGGAPAFTQTTNPISNGQLSGGQLEFGDWNGDSKTDLMYWAAGTGANRWFTNTYSTSLTFSQTNNPIGVFYFTDALACPIDWNGDGVTDVMTITPDPFFGLSHNTWFINNGSLSFTQYDDPISAFDTPVCYPNSYPSSTSNTHFGDWNGDGLIDYLNYVPTNGTNYWYLNNGALGFTKVTDPITPSTLTNEDYVLNVGDWNADGLNDVMLHLPNDGTNRWFTTSWNSSGQLVFSYTADPITKTLLSGTSGAVAMGDWNGDGFEDPMIRLTSSGTNRWWWKNGSKPDDRLITVTAGLQSDTSVTYKPLTDSTVYTRYTDAAYPVIDFEAPFYVVSRVDADNGIGGDYSSTYSYKGAKIDVSGRGFLGFAQQVASDLQTNIAQTLTFRQDFPFIGLVLEDKKTYTPPNPDVVLNDRDNTYNHVTLGSSNLRYWPFLESVTEASKDLNGATLPVVTTDYTYDTTYGNPLTITVTAAGATRTTTNTYSNNATTWIIGRLLSSTVVSTVP